MNINDLLPKGKVTAYLLGAAGTLAAFWLLVDVFNVLDEWPEPWILAAFVIIIGFIVAWLVPSSAFERSDGHTQE